MKLRFYKYEGAGNDFIMIDNRNRLFTPSQQVINNLCHRHFGIGADGLILLENDEQTNFNMRYFNADGFEGTLCGNGGRCITLFSRHLGITDNFAVFNAVDGIHKAEIISTTDNKAIVKLKMNDVTKIESIDGFIRIDTGSPHIIIPSKNLIDLDVPAIGRKIRYNKKYSEQGVNVNFIRISGNAIEMRTYERGVENETLACGTGAVAAAIAAMDKNGFSSPVDIAALGGDLRVYAKKQAGGYSDIWLQGSACFVFEGFIETGLQN